MKENRNKYLLKNTIIFFLGNFGSKFISFLLVPLYTNVLTKTEYGTVDLMTVLTTVLVPIISLNISESIMRFSMDKDSNKNSILSIAIIFSIISSIISFAIIPIFNLYSITKNYSILISLYILSFTSSTIFLCYIRGIEKLMDYSIINIIQSLLIAVLNLVLLLKYNMGIKGYIISYIIAYTISIIICIFRGKIISTVKKIKIDKSLLKNMLRFSVLLIPNALMWWIMNSLDRVMITSMIGTDANGIYAVSYKIPSILIVLTTIFNQAWMFSAVKEKDSADKHEYTNKVFKALLIFVNTAGLLIITIIKPLTKLYVGSNFVSAWKYTSPLIVGTVFLTISTFLSNEYNVNKDSKGFLKSSFVGAIVNLILNFILIPRMQILGAALATCISYISVFIFRLFDTKKYVKIKIDVKVMINFVLLAISMVIVYIDEYGYFINALLFIILLIVNNEFWKSFVSSLIKQLKKRRIKNV